MKSVSQWYKARLRLRARGRAWRRRRGRAVSVFQLLVQAAAGTGRGGEWPRRRGGAFPLALLLLHASVLEPNLHLSLVELERGGDLHAPRSGQVLAKVELLLQLRQLPRAEVGAHGVVVGKTVVGHFDCERDGQAVRRMFYVLLVRVIRKALVVTGARCVRY